jgi:hypothetical protein
MIVVQRGSPRFYVAGMLAFEVKRVNTGNAGHRCSIAYRASAFRETPSGAAAFIFRQEIPTIEKSVRGRL